MGSGHRSVWLCDFSRCAQPWHSSCRIGEIGGKGKLERLWQGVYRFPEWPISANDHLMEAVLWTRDSRAVLSHETALEVYELCDINPDKVHVTIPARAKKLRRRTAPASLIVHYEDLEPVQVGWWEGIPTVTVPTAISQCIATGTRADLVLQAIDTARRLGRIDRATAEHQRVALRGKSGHGA